MELKDGDYVVGCWILDKKDVNFLLTIAKKDEEWVGEYRFRYIKDDKIWDSADRKSFYKMKFPKTETEENIIVGIRQAMEGYSKEFKPERTYEVLIQSKDVYKFMYEMAKVPCMNMSHMEPKNESIR